MFSEPKIVGLKDPTKRGYVLSYVNGTRVRLYNGSALGIDCFPNHQKDPRDREKALKHLLFEFRKRLEKGWVSVPTEHSVAESISIRQLPTWLSRELERVDFSASYKRDLITVCRQMHQFLKDKKMESVALKQLPSRVMQEFLSCFSTSATYYMTKRRTLGALFSLLQSKKVISENPVKQIKRVREKATLHKPYERNQLNRVLSIIASKSPKLHLCCCLMYGCLLRPNQEIRKLKRSDIDQGITRITLAGNANKGKRIRTVAIPRFVREVLIDHGVMELPPETNVFTGTVQELNVSYFSTLWSRIKPELKKESLVERSHTLYSFRHTAAVEIYKKTKDAFVVKNLMGHSSLTVTLTYLRSVGVEQNDDHVHLLEL